MRMLRCFLFTVTLAFWLVPGALHAEKMPQANPPYPTMPMRYEEWTWEGTVDTIPTTLIMRGWSNNEGSFVGSGVCIPQKGVPRFVTGGIFALWWPLAKGMRLWECPPGAAACTPWYGDTYSEDPTEFRAREGYIGDTPSRFELRRTRRAALDAPPPPPVRPLPVPPQALAGPRRGDLLEHPGLAQQLAGMLSPEHYEIVQGMSPWETAPCFMGSQGSLLCAGTSDGWPWYRIALAVNPQGRVDVLLYNFFSSRADTWHYTNDTRDVAALPGDINEALRLWPLESDDPDPTRDDLPWMHLGPLSTQTFPIVAPATPTVPVHGEERTWTGTLDGTPVTVTMRGQADAEGRFTGAGTGIEEGRPPFAVAGAVFPHWPSGAKGMWLWGCADGADRCLQWNADVHGTDCTRNGIAQWPRPGEGDRFADRQLSLCLTERKPAPLPPSEAVAPQPMPPEAFENVMYFEKVLAMPGMAQRLTALLPPPHYELLSTLSLLPFDPQSIPEHYTGEGGCCLTGPQGAVCAGSAAYDPSVHLALFVSPQGRLDVLIHTPQDERTPRAWHYTTDAANAATLPEHLDRTLALWGIPRDRRISWMHVSAVQQETADTTAQSVAR